ncbi:MAG: hypothetical protein GY862_27545 [Gammaproteobacteria bacterium]|nr:hypothetical protein [Gammaproteobacteria bacterium]
MISKKAAQSALASLQAKLNAWESSVPSSALRFHRSRSTLSSQIQQCLKKFKLWFSEDEIDRFKRQGGNLEAMAGDLGPLIGQADDLKKRVEQLQQRASAGAELDVWLRDRCGELLPVLSRMGADCEQEGELWTDKNELTEIEAKVKLYEEALRWIKNATKALDVFGSSSDTAKLEAELPGLKQELLNGNTAPDWIENLKKLVRPLQDQIGEEQQKKERTSEILGSISANLVKLRGWSEVLGGMQKTEINHLNRRHRQYREEMNNLHINEADDLNREVQQFLAQMPVKGEEIRHKHADELKKSMRDFFQHLDLGDADNLETQLDLLEKKQVDRYQLQREWLRDFTELQERFKSIAQNELVNLQEPLQEAAVHMEKDLQHLMQKKMLSQTRQEANRLISEVEALQHRHSLKGVLRGLQELDAFEKEVETVKAEAEKDLQEGLQKQRELKQRFKRLQGYGERIEFPVRDDKLAAEIDGLTEASADDKDLEDAQKHAESLEAEIEQHEQIIDKKCRSSLDAQVKKLQAKNHTLERIGSAPVAVPDSSSIPAGNLDEIVKMAEDGGQLLEKADQAAEDKEKELDRKRSELQARFEEINRNLDALQLAERDEVKELLKELRDDSPDPDIDVLERLESLGYLVERAEYFLEESGQDGKELEKRITALRQRVKKFRREGLHKELKIELPEHSGHPIALDLFSQVEALVYGIPGHLRQPESIRRQLELAETWFERLNNQARRLAAQRFAKAVEILEKRARDSKAAPQFAAKAKTLLNELDKWSKEEFPPAKLHIEVSKLIRTKSYRRTT